MDFEFSNLIFGAILAVAGYLYRGRQERITEYKSLLFIYLEILFACGTAKRTGSEEFLSIYLKCIEKHTGAISPQQRETLIPLLRKQVAKMMDLSRTPSSTLTAEYYSSLIKQLAKRDPILAFELSDSADIPALMNLLNDEIEHITTEHQADLSNPADKAFATNATLRVTDEILDHLEKDIARLAWKSDVVTWIRAKSKVRRLRKLWAFSDATQINEIVEKFVIPALKVAVLSSAQPLKPSGA